MNVLFFGSREIGDAMVLKKAAAIVRSELGRLDFSTDVVIHGGAVGVDTLVDMEAKRLSFQVSVYEPNYRMWGKRAPLLRDDEMVRAAQCAVGIWNGWSNGTAYTARKMRMSGKPMRFYSLQYDMSFSLEECPGL